MIKFEHVFKKYSKTFYTLYDANFEIEHNTAIVGDKISGGFAVTRLIAKIEKQNEGKIFVDGIELNKIKNKDLDVALVTMEPFLFKHKNIRANLMYPLKIRGYGEVECKKLVDEIYAKYNLNTIEQNIKKQTKSEQKIITLLRAIIHKPKYLLLEYFFEDFDENFLPLATEILVNTKSTIIACEEKLVTAFEKFNIMEISNGTITKKE